MRVIGLNCGTSVDGIDVAELDITPVPDSPDVCLHLLSYREHPVPPSLQHRILLLCRPGAETTLEEVCDLNFEIGELFASAVVSSGIALDKVDLVASHGQTLWHSPIQAKRGEGFERGERRMSTLQMGESAVISRVTGLTCVSDFRVSELAVGRMGAPLAGPFEAALLRHPTALRVSQNLGGMGNATVIPPSASPLSPGFMAFDTGPGNVLIDAAVRTLSSGQKQYDADGALARRGQAEVDEAYIEQWIGGLEYLHRQPPKTTGRELFSDDMARTLVRDLQARGLSDAGVVATITRLTAETVARALEAFVVPVYGKIDELFICGGGAENPVIFEFLARRFPTSRVAKLNEATDPQTNGHGDTNKKASAAHQTPGATTTTTTTAGAGTGKKGGIPAIAKEAVMFALLGYLCVHGRSVPVASNEKSKAETIMGKITPGSNFADVLGKAQAVGEHRTLGRIIV